ncbi:homeobox-containing protein 1 isoform X6 [Cololabis saira]|uniref:homeobox-containing protein 1 isoform X6 n=1 Tax=Cololabis saira TaxID=129043 RepID=UPI002AD4A488|nr:homeobox-containing protein 1 isoform X6 [Cololabis saira]
MRQWCVPAATPRAAPTPERPCVSPPPPDPRMECCEMEPRYTIEQIDLLQRLRLSGMTKPQILHALESLERLDPDHRSSHCDSRLALSGNAPAIAAPAPSSSSSSSSLSLASATTQTSGLDGAALSPSNSYEASPPPLYSAGVAAQRSFSYDMMGEEEWDLEEKVEEYMRRDSNLVKEEIKSFLNSRRISQAIVGQVTGATLSMRSLVKEEPDWRMGIMAGDRAGMVAGPLRLRRGSRFTWRKECQSIMESFFMENQYPDEAKREEIANACNSVIQKPGCKLSEFERVTALKVYNWFANRRKEMKRRANIEAAILESHGIEVPSPSCHSNGEDGEMPEFTDQVNHRFSEQAWRGLSLAWRPRQAYTMEETSSQKIMDHQDPSSLAAPEVSALPSPTSQVTEQKDEDSKREPADEE